MKLPFIIIFDIDNTIIGNVTNCTRENDILDIIYKNCKKNKITDECIINKLDIKEELLNGLLRPNFKDFVDFCEKKYKNVEIFVYTNASSKWINNSLLSNIEIASKVKFNKPYFTREDSVNYDKNLSNIYDRIMKALVKKYPVLNNQKYNEKVFEERFIMIDDLEKNIKDYPEKQILCPSYDYYCYYNIKEKIMSKYKIPEDVFNHKSVIDYYAYYSDDLPFYNVNGRDYHKDKTYYNIMELKMNRYMEITAHKKDTFFLDMIKAIGDKAVLTNKNIEKINKELAKKIEI